MKEVQEEKNSLPCKSAFDAKLEKLANSNVRANGEVVPTVKLVSHGKTNHVEDPNEEFMSTAKLKSSDKMIAIMKEVLFEFTTAPISN